MDLQLIENRINTLKAQKQRFLAMKKQYRGNRIEEITQQIKRLKDWKVELTLKQLAKLTVDLALEGEIVIKAFSDMADAMKYFTPITNKTL